MNKAEDQAKENGLPLRVMFQDEARFGRINDPQRCWAPPGIRPVVKKQMVREYTYAYSAISPKDGVADFLILPAMRAGIMSKFLEEVSNRHQNEFILMVYDGAPCHSINALTLPKNIMIVKLPPYSPELNPTEHIWDDMREKFFGNHLFNSMDAVEKKLSEACVFYETSPEIVQSIAGFPWIVTNL